MNRKVPFLIFVVLLAGINTGTVRHTDDPIRDNQTSGIGYQQKMEEEKDGVKGPLAYSVKYNPKDTFFVDPPFDEKEKASAREKVKTEKKPPAFSDWWEEKPAQGVATPAPEESMEESNAVGEKEAPLEGPAEKAGSGAESGNDAKGGDSWW